MCFLKDISDYIRNGETTSQRLGLEIEHFIVDENGDQIKFDEISSLIEKVGNEIQASLHYIDGYVVGYNTDEYAISLEPSCQFEISISPYSDIKKIADVYRKFIALWEPIFTKRGYSIKTFGNLPKVELGIITPDDIPLSPKKRYEYMNRHFLKTGKYGKYMMRASASTQISIDYSSEEDMIRKIRLIQKLSPVFMILLESKTDENSTLKDAPDRPHLFRIQQWDDLDSDRTGFIPHSFDNDFGYDSLSNLIYSTSLILYPESDKTLYVADKSARDLFESLVIKEDDLSDKRKKQLIEHFISMGFFHLRVKTYIEIRVADSVPIDKALGYVALIKGLMYSKKNLDILEHALSDINSIEAINKAVDEIEKNGLNANIYHDKTAADWAEYIILLASNELDDEDKEYLKCVNYLE
ncbi:glutamate--cysteine ligase [Acetitomaculum ruminis DSM 5522]|uniref:glutamate--cysteine ligase n=1 Tax=Acetitomaculum ruminis DSM 5522 TaxID=1120918 RepID=A0A1I1A2L5_9FIRM|nr:glutamate-cysteine ligase family protein [Acetitomaculum ruminis]SFB30810.1 glutamate--cysteine ligase [Acetitomaculum ruminis DSM 5522]